MITKKVENLTSRLEFVPNAHHMRVFKNAPEAGKQTVYALDKPTLDGLVGLTGDDEDDLPIYEAAYQASLP